MKKITLILVLMISISIGKESKIDFENHNYFPEFMRSYLHLREWEGNYAHLDYDRGGETYAGIARNFNRNWDGWEVIDEHKRDSSIHWNKEIKEVEEHVIQYYYQIYLKEKFYKIKDQFIRTYLFDYRNSGTIAYRYMKEVLNHHGFQVGNNAVLDEKSIDALNKINPIIFILHLKEVRKEHYERVAEKNPELEIYLKGWINRANHIAV